MSFYFRPNIIHILLLKMWLFLFRKFKFDFGPSEGTELKLFIRILLTLSVAAIKLAFHKVRCPTCISDRNFTTSFKGDIFTVFCGQDGMLISRGAQNQTCVLKFMLVSTLIMDHFYVKQRWETR